MFAAILCVLSLVYQIGKYPLLQRLGICKMVFQTLLPWQKRFANNTGQTHVYIITNLSYKGSLIFQKIMLIY